MKANISRLVGIGIGMFFSSIALFLLFALYPVSGGIGTAIVFIPYLFTCWLVYRFACADDLESIEVCYLWDFYPKAFWRAVVAEACVCVMVVIFIFVLEWSGERQTNTVPHPTEALPPVMKN